MERTIVLKDGRSVLIRPLGADDVDRSLAFFQGLDADERRYLRRDVTDRGVIEARIREAVSPEVTRLVAVDDDTIVADGSLEHELYRWGDRGGQIRLIVAPAWRRIGLGTSLARLLYLVANQQDLARINVRILRPQQAARDIFHRLGFHEEYVIPDHVCDLAGHLQDLIVMRCNLSILYDPTASPEDAPH